MLFGRINHQQHPVDAVFDPVLESLGSSQSVERHLTAHGLIGLYDALQWGYGFSAVETACLRGRYVRTAHGFNGATTHWSWKARRLQAL
ncbi:MAG: hypothetical protein C7B47_14995 [Sulfobacillus thermosulfidooxidans]|uniref:Uncharacterized protein n=1 Tax=Sulfobacillus thermosulfidooxidans TaxID=28034 RepID=A0A2T2WQ30_SULTH|nr:MAG: hypothetical protein C7B47_14995 [Sulfobacillus thermosulfidooxidans]